MKCRVAIVGGGPGGLMTAYLLQKRCGLPFETTIYEASGRLGGKILTGSFESARVGYEAGAAELYDYSHVGPDPLRELISELGLSVRPMSGASIILNEQVLNDLDDVARVHGESTRRALLEFDARARRWMTPEAYYESDWQESNADPMALHSFEEELAKVPDAVARRFLATMVHSDVATEPHHTSAAYGLQNYLMNDAAYMRLYTIEGGIEELPRALAARVEAHVLLEERVLGVGYAPDQKLRVTSASHAGGRRSEEYDFVVAALPNHYLPAIEWQDEALSAAIHRHYLHHDHPAHYLRVSVLFREVFWREVLKDSYFMLDAFGGCCLYDESSRNGCKTYGVLGWLIAGNAAVTASNLSDAKLIELVLDSLPVALQHGRGLFLEGRVHRWIGAVNGMPGGSPALDMEMRHIPEPVRGDVFLVGDYLFDSTLNGVLDSAEYVAESLIEEMEAREAQLSAQLADVAQ